MQESYDKLAHQQRTEQAQQRREEKLKAETEKYMNEEDPVKARKLEVLILPSIFPTPADRKSVV